MFPLSVFIGAQLLVSLANTPSTSPSLTHHRSRDPGKEPPHVKTVWHDLLALFSSKKLVPLVYDKVYDGLDAIAEGLHDLETRKTWGKAVVRVRREDGKPSGKAAGGVLSKDAIRPGPNAQLPAKL